MLNALTVSLAADAAATQRTTNSMRRQGFVAQAQFGWRGGVMQAWSNPLQHAEEALFVDCAQGVACAIGPIWYRGRYGNDALRQLLDEIARPGAHAGGAEPAVAPPIEETELRGNFVLFLHAENRAWLLNDPLGFARIYTAGDGRFHSTSWLAARAWAEGTEIDEAAAIEYVLQGAVHSDRTVARGVSKLALGFGIDLDARRSYPRFPDGMVPPAEPAAGPLSGTAAGFDAAVEQTSAHLRTVFAEISGAFPGRTSAALSGGFDSRLIVAGLLAQGETPRLFVYGSEQSEDVPIARQVAQAEGLPITVIDKDAANRDLPSPDLAALVQSALFFDGLPNDGVFDPGADRNTRLAQSANGSIALNGGGGEIFRNFFHLPQRRYRPHDLVRAFYRGFDSGVFRRSNGLAEYEGGLAESIAASLGLPAEAAQGGGVRLSREQVELVYPFFRCHHWMGLNNSVAVRYGHFATPLVDLNLVRAAALLPLEWKNAGLFESRLIAALHPGIASHQSSYGFRFSEGPDSRARRVERLTRMRPVFARPLINAARRRLRKLGASPEFIARCRTMLPGEWRLDGVLDLTRLPDDTAFARALSIEIVSRELAP